MAVEDGKQLVVFEVSEPPTEMRLAEEAEMCEQLAHSDIWRQRPDFGEHGLHFPMHVRSHGSMSPTLGSAAYAFGSLPITSTRIVASGASDAALVTIAAAPRP
jgi:hypothetical protein